VNIVREEIELQVTTPNEPGIFGRVLGTLLMPALICGPIAFCQKYIKKRVSLIWSPQIIKS